MAFHRTFIIFVLISAFIPAITLAKEFIVGDENGWTTGFDYKTWAEGKDFRVGDKLVFKYPVGAHNVFKVNGTGFQNCIVPPQSEALTSGNDAIVLATPGRKWYICGVGKHCENGGQKLVITVQPQAIAPSFAPYSPLQSMQYYSSKGSKTTIFSQLYSGILVAIVSMVMVYY